MVVEDVGRMEGKLEVIFQIYANIFLKNIFFSNKEVKGEFHDN